MAKQITQYELLISCPGDIIDEVKIIEDVLLNNKIIIVSNSKKYYFCILKKLNEFNLF